jgi:hypothetical protein
MSLQQPMAFNQVDYLFNKNGLGNQVEHLEKS